MMSLPTNGGSANGGGNGGPSGSGGGGGGGGSSSSSKHNSFQMRSADFPLGDMYIPKAIMLASPMRVNGAGTGIGMGTGTGMGTLAGKAVGADHVHSIPRNASASGGPPWTPSPAVSGRPAVTTTPVPASAAASSSQQRGHGVSTPVPALSSHRSNGVPTPTPVFKNPLDDYGSPSPPPSKRPKTGHVRSNSNSNSNSDVVRTTGPVIKTSPTQARMQLTPSVSAAAAPPPPPLPRRATGPASSPMLSTQRLAQQPMVPRPPPVPSGFKQAIENNKVVLVLDDDDDDPPPPKSAHPPAAPMPSSSAPPVLAPPRVRTPARSATRSPTRSATRSPVRMLGRTPAAAAVRAPPPPSATALNSSPPPSYSLPSSLPPSLPPARPPSLPPSLPTSAVQPSQQSQQFQSQQLPSSQPSQLPQSQQFQSQQLASSQQVPPSQQPQSQHQSQKTPSQTTFTRFAEIARRPYLQFSHREFVSSNNRSVQKLLGRVHAAGGVIHVDFLPDEVQHIMETVRAATTTADSTKHKHAVPERELRSLLRKKDVGFLRLVLASLDYTRLPGRTETDVIAFIVDVRSGKHRVRVSRPPGEPMALTLCRRDRAAHAAYETRAARTTKHSTLLFGRELVGHRIVDGRVRQPVSFVNEVRKLREDSLTVCNTWTNCAGDITTISWTSNDTFVCGTTTHMDDRNHQYNRQGNLALASASRGRLVAYPDHRIPRRPQQARPGMLPATHTHDDPWLYTSVASSDFASVLNLAFTSSFDETVKAWRVDAASGTMQSMGTWRHKGKVHFVVASTHELGLVATAADVSEKSVRIYRFSNPQEGGRITYKVLPCPRIFDAAGRAMVPDKWAYLPAAVRWGISKETSHLLLVGFSPRSLALSSDDEDIPPERRDSGDLRLWDGRDGSAWKINGGTSRNVFEVAWHPTQACFIAATAVKSHNTDENVRARVRTQIRIFRPANTPENGGRVFAEVQTLDCYADDINELALLPSSVGFMFVAAGATNGKTYVWDTAQGDNPVHILEHDKCLEELAGERVSTEDTGVKFVAWGATPDRLYTGSSDGVVKVWNVRTHRTSKGASPFVRDLLHCPGPVSFGAFSPDKSRLAIGDASGRVTLLAVDDTLDKNDEDGFVSETDDEEEDAVQSSVPREKQPRQQQRQKTFKQHPPEIVRHATPPPPPPPPSTVPPPPSAILSQPQENADAADDDDGCAPARAFLAAGQLVLVPDRTVGAVKGPNYAQTQLYCLDFHYGRQPDAPLLAQYDRLQQENQPSARSAPSRQRALPDDRCMSIGNTALQLHRANQGRDLALRDLSPETRQQLQADDRGVLRQLADADAGIDDPCDFGFVYEELPDDL